MESVDSRHDLPIAPNLLNRNFTPARPNQAWTADITYITTEEGWLFLAVVIDLFSRKVVGISQLLPGLITYGVILRLRKPKK